VIPNLVSRLKAPRWPDTAQFGTRNPLNPARSGQSNKRPECSLDARRTSVHRAVALGSLTLRERESLRRQDTFNDVCVLAHVRGALKIKG
jgi:hypothetical protein